MKFNGVDTRRETVPWDGLLMKRQKKGRNENQGEDYLTYHRERSGSGGLGVRVLRTAETDQGVRKNNGRTKRPDEFTRKPF